MHASLKTPVLAFLFAGALISSASAGPLVDLSAEASRQAPNDQLQASAYVESTGENAQEVAKKANAAISEALAVGKNYPTVKVQSSGTQTYPVYGKNGRVDGWRMRSAISLQSKDHAAFSEMVGRLQKTLAIGDLGAVPSPETYRTVENGTIVDAITAFRDRAKIIAEALGKSYVIKEMNVGAQHQRPVPVFAMAKGAVAMAQDMAPAPIEAGEATVSVTVSGKIEVAD